MTKRRRLVGLGLGKYDVSLNWDSKPIRFENIERRRKKRSNARRR